MNALIGSALLTTFLLASCGVSTTQKAAQEARRLEFCRIVQNSIKEEDEYCRPYFAQLKRERKQREATEKQSEQRRRHYAGLDIQGKCKKYIGQLMGQSPDIMTARLTSNDYNSAMVTYQRDDGTFWHYECITDGKTITWRSINVSESGGIGRWREEDRVSIQSL